MNKSQYDTNDYRSYVLENGLTVIQIYNTTATMSGVSLLVQAGSYDESIDGIAHFTEHLLFMGSEKYPKENTYGSYISENGGTSNAWTADTYTNYIFSVNSTALVTALDMFSQMFISPLFGESSVQREITAVDSEFTNYCNSDYWRSAEVLKCIANKSHPYSRFNVGNKESLNIPNIVQHVKDFYNQKYSSNVMKLCVVSDMDPNILESHIREMFGQILNKNCVVNKTYPQMFTSLNKTIKVIPIKKTHTMSILWQLEITYDEMTQYKYKPSTFLSHIFGHEGKGSILAKLKALGWASNLSAGNTSNCYTYELFEIQMVLTDEGIQNINGILNIIYNYIDVCRTKLSDYSKCEALYNDNKNSNNLTWTFLPKSDALNNAITITSIMHSYDCVNLSDLNKAPFHYESFDEIAHSLINQQLHKFVQSNSIVKLSSKNFIQDQTCYCTEQWYHALYNVEDNEILEFPVTFTCLDIPENNAFIPENLSMTVSESDWNTFPILIKNTPTLQLYAKKTGKFGLPHAIATFILNVDEYYSDPTVNILVTLLAQTVMSQLNDTLYDAQLLNYNVSLLSSNGLTIVLNGYHDKLPQLLKVLVDLLVSGELKESFFDIVKEKLRTNLQNEKLTESSRVIENVLRSNVDPQYISTDAKLSFLEQLSFENLLAYAKILNFEKCVALFEGNVNNTFVDLMINQIDRLSIQGIDSSNQCAILEPMTNVDSVFSKVSENQQEKNDCILVVYCNGKYHPLLDESNFKLKALASLVNIFIAEPFFDDLRTNQQLGYSVYSYPSVIGRDFQTITTQNFLIQSPTTPCEELLKRIDTFIQKSLSKMTQLDDQTFETYVNTLVTRLLKPDDSLNNSANTDLSAILSKHYIFDIKLRIAESAKLLQKQDLIDFFTEKYSASVKRYVINLTSTCLDVTANVNIHDIAEDV